MTLTTGAENYEKFISQISKFVTFPTIVIRAVYIVCQPREGFDNCWLMKNVFHNDQTWIEEGWELGRNRGPEMTNQRGHVWETEPEMIVMTMVINSVEMLWNCHLPDDGLVKMLMVHPVHGEEGVQPIRGNTGRQTQLPLSVNVLFWTVQPKLPCPGKLWQGEAIWEAGDWRCHWSAFAEESNKDLSLHLAIDQQQNRFSQPLTNPRIYHPAYISL